MKYSFFLFLVGVLFCSCDKEETPTVDIRDEIITNLGLTFTPTDGSSIVAFAFEDLGNTSGLPSSQSSEPLSINKTYEVKADFLSRTNTANNFLTGKIRAAGTDYQVFMSVSPDNVFQNIEYADMDDNAQPIGLQTTLTTSERFTTGSLRVMLIENPDKSLGYVLGDNVPSGTGGKVELEATFNLIIQ